jgi:hypothetical protein
MRSEMVGTDITVTTGGMIGMTVTSIAAGRVVIGD